MTNEQQNYAMREAPNYTDIDAYVSDIALSEPFVTEDGTIPEDLITDLRRLWYICNAPFSELLDGRKMTDVAERFCIPYRTLQDWCRGERECTNYLRLFIANALGYQPKT